MLKKIQAKKQCSVTEVFEGFGPYHLMQYTLACLPSMFVTMININYIFVAGDLDYRCRIPECEDSRPTSVLPPWWPNSTIDRCSKPVLKQYWNGICTDRSFTEDQETCTEWVYESNNSMIAELDLACQPWKTNMIGSIHNIGMLISMAIFGLISDRFGRKPTVIFCAVCSCIGHLKTFAPSYFAYVSVEFLEALVSGGIYVGTNVLLIEIGGKKTRVLAGVLFAYLIYLGEMIFAVVAMSVPHWKTLIRIINTPPLLFISYILLLKESPRWQILNGRTEEAKKTIKFAAEMNNLMIDEEELKHMDDSKLRQKFNVDSYEVREGLNDIFTSREILKRLLVASVCRFTVGFVYYGLMINSVWLPGNKYTNFLLSTVMSFPGELIALYLMTNVGRKIPLIVGYFICGLMCIASAYVEPVWAKIALYLLGKMLISACFTGIITYTMELYPTSTRSSLLGIGSIMTRLGAMLAPLTPMLASISPALPCIVFATPAFVSGVLLTLTPETKDLPLMDTIGQVNAHAKARDTDKDIYVTKI